VRIEAGAARGATAVQSGEQSVDEDRRFREGRLLGEELLAGKIRAPEARASSRSCCS